MNTRSFYSSDRKLIFGMRSIHFLVTSPSLTSNQCFLPQLNRWSLAFTDDKYINSLQKQYVRTSLIIESIAISEEPESSKIDQQTTKLLDTRVSLNHYACIYKDHPTLTDQKLHVLIPYLRIEISDDVPIFMECLSSMKISRNFKSDGESYQESATLRPAFIVDDKQGKALSLDTGILY